MERVEVTSGRLYVGNLDYGVTGDDLSELFQSAGTVVRAEVVVRQESGRSKGFAFVEMSSIEEAKVAVEKLHDEEFKGRKLLISGAKSEGQRSEDRGASRPPRESRESGEGGGRSERREDRPRREERRSERGERGGRPERGGGRSHRGGGDYDSEPEAPRKPKVAAETVAGTKLAVEGLSAQVTAADLAGAFEGLAAVVGVGLAEGDSRAVVEVASVEEAQRALEVLTGKTFMGGLLRVTGAKEGEGSNLTPVEAIPEPEPVVVAAPVSEEAPAVEEAVASAEDVADETAGETEAPAAPVSEEASAVEESVAPAEDLFEELSAVVGVSLVEEISAVEEPAASVEAEVAPEEATPAVEEEPAAPVEAEVVPEEATPAVEEEPAAPVEAETETPEQPQSEEESEGDSEEEKPAGS